MTRQQRLKKLVDAFAQATRSGDSGDYERAKFDLAVYVYRNAHRITIASGT